MTFCVFVFFFQAEDGIRDVAVTGVQTCALPISKWTSAGCLRASLRRFRYSRAALSAAFSLALLAAKCPSSCATQYPRESSLTYRSLSMNTLRLGRCVNMALAYPAGTLRRNILVVSMYFQCGTKRTRSG